MGKIDQYIDVLNKCALFKDMQKDEIAAILNCLRAHSKKFSKNSFVFEAGNRIDRAAVVLSGEVDVVYEDFFGNRTILARIHSGGMFAEAFSCVQSHPIFVSATVVEQCEILFLDYARIFSVCSSACSRHTTLIKNMMMILAQKNIMLIQKINILTQRSTRKKLLAYLSTQKSGAQGEYFSIPFNRQELADYLSVDRSAMCSELSRLKSEGVLDFKRNKFVLKKYEFEA